MEPERRPYDLVAFGCTGFSGCLVVEHLDALLEKSKEPRSWALAGRRLGRWGFPDQWSGGHPVFKTSEHVGVWCWNRWLPQLLGYQVSIGLAWLSWFLICENDVDLTSWMTLLRRLRRWSDLIMSEFWAGTAKSWRKWPASVGHDRRREHCWKHAHRLLGFLQDPKLLIIEHFRQHKPAKNMMNMNFKSTDRRLRVLLRTHTHTTSSGLKLPSILGPFGLGGVIERCWKHKKKVCLWVVDSCFTRQDLLWRSRGVGGRHSRGDLSDGSGGFGSHCSGRTDGTFFFLVGHGWSGLMFGWDSYSIGDFGSLRSTINRDLCIFFFELYRVTPQKQTLLSRKDGPK